MISFGLTLHLPKVYEQDRSRREHPAGSALPSASRNFRKVEMSIRDTQNSIMDEDMAHPDKVNFLRVLQFRYNQLLRIEEELGPLASFVGS